MTTEKKKSSPKKSKKKVLAIPIGRDERIDKLVKEREVIFKRIEPIWEHANKVVELRAERDELNNKVKTLSEQARKIKSGRDFYNKRVREEKEKRDVLNKKCSDLRQNSMKKFGDAAKNYDPRYYSNLGRQVKGLRWKIETAGVDFSEERKLRASLDRMEREYESLKDVEDARRGKKGVEEQAKEHHANVVTFSQQSEKAHTELIKIYEGLKQARADANEKHQQVLDEMAKKKKLEDKHAKDIRRLEELKGKIKNTKKRVKEKQKEEVEKTVKERADSAFKDLESGKRVDLRDLQLKFLKEKEESEG